MPNFYNVALDYNVKKVHFNKKTDIKLGKVWTFNKVAGCSAMVFNDCVVNGSCPSSVPCWDVANDGNLHKNPCYCGKNYQQYKESCVKCHAINTIGVREDLTEVQNKLNGDLQRAKKPVLVRIHQFGELESVHELMMWVNLAINNPRHTFGIYTKRVDIVRRVILEIGKFPPNFTMNISVWEDTNLHFAMWFVDNGLGNAFGVLTDTKGIRTEIITSCPAYATGKLDHEITCGKNGNGKWCGKCYRNAHKFILCNKH